MPRYCEYQIENLFSGDVLPGVDLLRWSRLLRYSAVTEAIQVRPLRAEAAHTETLIVVIHQHEANGGGRSEIKSNIRISEHPKQLRMRGQP